MNKGGGPGIIIKALSTALFSCNYAGVLYGAFTFANETNEDKKKVR
jgi:hypothetical protein